MTSVALTNRHYSECTCQILFNLVDPCLPKVNIIINEQVKRKGNSGLYDDEQVIE